MSFLNINISNCPSSYYDATIDRISDDGTTCTVTLEPFGSTEITKV